MWTHQDQLKAQRQSMEKSRFGYTREEVLDAKGRRCAKCGNTNENVLQIDHKDGGGRHATEMGKIIPGKTHSMSNLQVLCDVCLGTKDKINGLKGIGLHGIDYHKAA
jgi:5-methylcytosine-specific restriction endonuclease McrA